MSDALVHRHLILAGAVERESVVHSELSSWLLHLASTIGMRPLSSPHIHYSDTPGNTGFVGMLPITTSHISIHHWDCCSPPLLQLDIYSCREFDVATAVVEIHGFWNIISGSAALISRGHSYSPGFSVEQLNLSWMLREALHQVR